MMSCIKGLCFISFKDFTFKVFFWKEDFIDSVDKIEVPSLHIGIAVCIDRWSSDFSTCLAREFNSLQIFMDNTFVRIAWSVSITCL